MTAYGVPNGGTGTVERKPTRSKKHFLLVYNIYVSKIRGAALFLLKTPYAVNGSQVESSTVSPAVEHGIPSFRLSPERVSRAAFPSGVGIEHDEETVEWLRQEAGRHGREKQKEG